MSDKTATERMRALLDERGVRYETYHDVALSEVDAVFWQDRNGQPCSAIGNADDIPEGMLSVQCIISPEQAIAATLGRGTCKWEPADFITEGEWWNTSCGESFTWEPDGTPRFCPNCGREVVE